MPKSRNRPKKKAPTRSKKQKKIARLVEALAAVHQRDPELAADATRTIMAALHRIPEEV